MIKFVYTNPFFKRYKYIFTSLKALNFSKIKSLQKEIIEKKNVEKKGVENKGIEQISALKYFTKLEIFYLFFIPFAFVSTYIFFMWNVFKYICGVKDINHFFKLIRWLNGKDSYPFDHLHNKKIEKKAQPIILSVKKFE
ncbi:conserved Plasmodium protein, unknown function [Plasmodium vinckei]|uniref:Uncharacterized protein n=2 Tax=Plasmodium vinckei TaxID=5860 RepID=A0A6V7TG12_PLAVN|nr:conserved Plasmodium protein, unknown function [Plasmodium vinckei]CAD2114167.1 conserved Plasmodium protein, unknown function [Plasmodium vinckei petteri]